MIRLSEFLRNKEYIIFDNDGINKFLQEEDIYCDSKVKSIDLENMIIYYPELKLELLFDKLSDEILYRYLNRTEINLTVINYLSNTNRLKDLKLIKYFSKFKHDLTKIIMYPIIIYEPFKNFYSPFDSFLSQIKYMTTEQLSDDIDNIIDLTSDYFINLCTLYDEYEINFDTSVDSEFIFNVRGDIKRNNIIINYFIDTIYKTYSKDNCIGISLYHYFKNSKHKLLLERMKEKYYNDKLYKQLILEVNLSK